VQSAIFDQKASENGKKYLYVFLIIAPIQSVNVAQR
jgi:hypothetical protein